MPSEPLGQADVIDLMSESLMAEGSDALRQMFNAEGARAPIVIWEPSDDELQSPLLERFARQCREMAGEDGKVRLTAFHADTLDKGLVDWLMIVEVQDDDFRYRAYGKGIAEYYGRDLTGMTTKAFTGHIAAFFEALYRTSACRGEWALSEHEPPRSVFVRIWRRLIVPLFTEDGSEVAAFAVLNLPENELRTGLELMVDPVFVADRDQVVHYANGAAREMFGIRSNRMADRTLRQLTGIGFEALPGPSDMLARRQVCESTELHLAGGIAERLISTVSAAEYRGEAYHVVVLRQLGT
jgi:PAS domain-containing protein